MASNPNQASSYYGRHAYRSEQLPQQKRPAPGANAAVPWFNRKVDRKLPWGGTKDVAPQIIRRRYRPEFLRRQERHLGQNRPTGRGSRPLLRV